MLTLADKQHLSHCTLRREEHVEKQWYCVKCATMAYSIGCPAHGCAPDPEVTTYGNTPNDKR